MEVITSNKRWSEVNSQWFQIYTKQITKPRNIRWRYVPHTTYCKATLTTTLVNDDPELVVFKSTFKFFKQLYRKNKYGDIFSKFV